MLLSMQFCSFNCQFERKCAEKFLRSNKNISSAVSLLDMISTLFNSDCTVFLLSPSWMVWTAASTEANEWAVFDRYLNLMESSRLLVESCFVFSSDKAQKTFTLKFLLATTHKILPLCIVKPFNYYQKLLL